MDYTENRATIFATVTGHDWSCACAEEVVNTRRLRNISAWETLKQYGSHAKLTFAHSVGSPLANIGGSNSAKCHMDLKHTHTHTHLLLMQCFFTLCKRHAFGFRRLNIIKVPINMYKDVHQGTGSVTQRNHSRVCLEPHWNHLRLAMLGLHPDYCVRTGSSTKSTKVLKKGNKGTKQNKAGVKSTQGMEAFSHQAFLHIWLSSMSRTAMK